MRYYKVDADAVPDLEFEHDHSTLFKLRSFITPKSEVVAYNPHQKGHSVPVRLKNDVPYISIQPQFRVLVSTGIVFSIPTKFQLRVTSNKALALSNGITLLNGTEIYDNDYTEELRLTLFNNSDTPVHIFNNEVIAEATLNKVLEYTLEPTSRKVAVKNVESTEPEDEDKTDE